MYWPLKVRQKILMKVESQRKTRHGVKSLDYKSPKDFEKYNS